MGKRNEERICEHEKAGTWEDAVLPEGRKLVSCKWVYKTKRDQHGEITSQKGRIVAKDYSQIPGQDFDAISSPVARMTSLRVILTIAAKQNLVLGQMDFVAAFLNGVLADLYGVSTGVYTIEGSQLREAKQSALRFKASGTNLVGGIGSAPCFDNGIQESHP